MCRSNRTLSNGDGPEFYNLFGPWSQTATKASKCLSQSLVLLRSGNKQSFSQCPLTPCAYYSRILLVGIDIATDRVPTLAF